MLRRRLMRCRQAWPGLPRELDTLEVVAAVIGTCKRGGQGCQTYQSVVQGGGHAEPFPMRVLEGSTWNEGSVGEGLTTWVGMQDDDELASPKAVSEC